MADVGLIDEHHLHNPRSAGSSSQENSNALYPHSGEPHVDLLYIFNEDENCPLLIGKYFNYIPLFFKGPKLSKYERKEVNAKIK